jgi:hypothetical protein
MNRHKNPCIKVTSVEKLHYVPAPTALGDVEAQQMLPEPDERFHGNAIPFAT